MIAYWYEFGEIGDMGEWLCGGAWALSPTKCSCSRGGFSGIS